MATEDDVADDKIETDAPFGRQVSTISAPLPNM